ncbi:MAG TPA: cold shock domain-containing protein, partial [Sorangium sp.]|nr:cold shock domain-containing protein [Sorangium sp.]
HPAQDTAGVITKLFSDYGFITTTDGREIYFHERSILSGPFSDLKIGMGVAYTEEDGDKGPQASTVRIVDARGGNRGREEIPTLS